jgi:hypothetical protein
MKPFRNSTALSGNNNQTFRKSEAEKYNGTKARM